MSETYSVDLARWGLLEAAQREAARDQLMAAVAEPPEPVLAVLRQQQPDADPALLARRWRWQQWCEQQAGAKLASHFLARKAGLDQVSFWRLSCPDGELAAELYQQLREGERSFAQLAQQGGAAWQAVFTGPVALEQLPAELAGLLRVSEVGVLWSPRQAQDGSWQLLQLEQRIPAVLTQELRRNLLLEMGELLLDIGINH